jgi:RimJ/RimL family protein N-acetyltransferase
VLLLFKSPKEWEKKNIEMKGLEVVTTFSRALELKLVTPFAAWQFIAKLLMRKIYCIYVIIRDNRCIHTSHVIGKGWRFPFMNKEDIEIGPCWTDRANRNQGIFTAVIQQILYDYSSHQGWMICDEDNAASRRGIEKAGLELIARGNRTRPFGCRIIGRFEFSGIR